MWTITYLAGILAAIGFMLLGWLISQLLRKNKKVDWESKYKVAEKSNSDLQKKVKNERMQVEQQKKKADDYKVSLDNLKREKLQLEDNLTESKRLSSQADAAFDKEKKILDNEVQRLTRINEKLDKDLSQQRAKYKTDMADMLNWKSDKQKVEKEIKELKSKLNRYIKSSSDYKFKYESQLEQIEKINEVKRNTRASKAKIAKLEADIKYWEKKHYDTHHEYAELKKTTESIKDQSRKLEELRKGDEILKANLVNQISEFKTKYLDISEKYRGLTNKSN